MRWKAVDKRCLKVAIEQTSLLDFYGYRDYLAALYQRLKQEDAGCTYLDFAEVLGFNRTNVVWMFLTGRRAISEAAAKRICKHAGITGIKRQYFLTMVRYGSARDPNKRESLFQKMVELKNAALPTSRDQQTLEYFSEWHHPVLRELIRLPDFSASPDWINRHLYNKILPKKIAESFQLLRDLGLIEEAVDGRDWVLAPQDIMPGRAVQRMSAVRFHQKMLEVAKESITRVPSQQRDLNAVTFTVGARGFELVKKRIRELCAEILKLEAENTDDQLAVYQFNSQLFALSMLPEERHSSVNAVRETPESK